MRIIGNRLPHLHAQDALLLLCHSFAIPKLLYTLWTTPWLLSEELGVYDEVLKSITSSIVNVYPLATQTQRGPKPLLLIPQPPSPVFYHQSAWDAPRISASAQALLIEAPDTRSQSRSQAHLLAAGKMVPGWMPFLCPRWDYTWRIRPLKLPLALDWAPHFVAPTSAANAGPPSITLPLMAWVVSGVRAYTPATQQLITSCTGQLSSAKIPSRLEPSRLYRSDKAPWRVFHSALEMRKGALIWDATFLDTFAPSYLPSAVRGAAWSGGCPAEQLKNVKYSHLDYSHYFVRSWWRPRGSWGRQQRTSYGTWANSSTG